MHQRSKGYLSGLVAQAHSSTLAPTHRLNDKFSSAHVGLRYLFWQDMPKFQPDLDFHEIYVIVCCHGMGSRVLIILCGRCLSFPLQTFNSNNAYVVQSGGSQLLASVWDV